MSAAGTYAATGATQLVLGGVQNFIFEDLGWERSTIAYAVTAGTWASGLLTPFAGRLADRYGPRGLMPLAALIAGACFFALAGVSAVWHFYAAYIVAPGHYHFNHTGTGFSFHLSIGQLFLRLLHLLLHLLGLLH